MATFVLVHGAFHGAWCWEKVVPLLEQAGHRVVARDLPGHGSDPTPPDEVTLDSYARAVAALLDDQPEPVVLVGHSMGGGVITQAAEYRPEKIRLLVYLCAHLLKDGQSMADVRERNTESLVVNNQVFSEDRKTMTIREAAIRDAFYQDCAEDDVSRAKARLTPQATAPFAQAVHTTEGGFGRVPRAYIATLRDQALVPELQKLCYTQLPCREVIEMDSGHSPFFSRPEELAGHLLALESRPWAAPRGE